MSSLVGNLVAGRDPDRPGHYRIVHVTDDTGGSTYAGNRVLWRDLRSRDPEAFVNLARATLADWTTRNGW